MPAASLRFSTARIFYFVTLCASSTALFGWLGIPIGCFVMLIWMQVLAGARREQLQVAAQTEPAETQAKSLIEAGGVFSRRNGVSKLELVVALLIATLVIGLMVPARIDFDLQQQAALSMNMVAKAVEAYEQHFGVPPPSVIRAPDGTPLHSWRALILPFLGEEKLAAAYRFNEPWNGPHNQLLAQYRPWHYRTFYPADQYTTALVGDCEVTRTSTTLQLCPQTATRRTLVVEQEQAVNCWLQPTESVELEALSIEPHVRAGFWQRGFFTSAYRGRLAVDGHQTWRVHPRTSTATLLSQIALDRGAIGDGKSQELIDVGQPLRQWHLDNGMRLTLFLLVVLYPLRWLTQIDQSNSASCQGQPRSMAR